MAFCPLKGIWMCRPSGSYTVVSPLYCGVVFGNAPGDTLSWFHHIKGNLQSPFICVL